MDHVSEPRLVYVWEDGPALYVMFQLSVCIGYMSLWILSWYGNWLDCMNDFQGGSWVLVRRVKSGSTWHPATFVYKSLHLSCPYVCNHIRDHLLGTESYGTYVSDSVSDSTFSTNFAALLSPSTEMLFATGDKSIVCADIISRYSYTPFTHFTWHLVDDYDIWSSCWIILC